MPADRAEVLGARALVSTTTLDSLRSSQRAAAPSLRVYGERAVECQALRSYLQTLGYRRDVANAADLGVPLLRMSGSQGTKIILTMQADGLAITDRECRAPLRLIEHELEADLPIAAVAAAARRATERLAVTGHLLLVPSRGAAFDSLRLRRKLCTGERFRRDITGAPQRIAA